MVRRFEFGDYQLLEEIARGGMGAIFRARQVSLNRIVAVKVILLGQFATVNDVRRFHAEAESAAVLRHEGIVPIYASGEYEGNPYFSMQFIEGSTLANLIASKSMNGRTAARLLSSIADAVAYAHSKGIIHRDLKPSNILINKHGDPIITDFGLAKRSDTDPNLTGTGQIIGTPNYMSPEQASGLNHLISTRSDIYSLGAILYAMCAGKPPFESGTMIETLKQVTTELPAPLQRVKNKVDRDLETIAFKCLDKNPASRYQSSSELKEDLDRYLNHEPIKASATSLATRTSRWFRRNPALALLSSIVACMVIALAIGGPIIAYRQSKLQKSTRESLEKQNRLAQELRGTTASINANLVKIYTERGDAAVNAGNPLAALPSYTAALRGSIEAGQREWGHRFPSGFHSSTRRGSNFDVGNVNPTYEGCDQSQQRVHRLHNTKWRLVHLEHKNGETGLHSNFSTPRCQRQPTVLCERREVVTHNRYHTPCFRCSNACNSVAGHTNGVNDPCCCR